MNIASYILNALFLLLNRSNYKRFMRSTHQVERIQLKRLKKILHKSRHAEFGLSHHFETINSIEDFQNQIPIRSYEDYMPYIRQIMRGEPNILISEKVSYLAITSGTSSASKYIPYSAPLKKEFSRTINVWLYDLLINHKKLWGGKQFWIVSPATKLNPVESKIPVGFEKDSNYLGFFERHLVKHLMILPDSLTQLKSTGNYNHLICLILLANRNVRLLSVWNPSMLISMIHYITNNYSMLLDSIATGTANIPEQNIESDNNLAGKIVKRDTKRAKELKNLNGKWMDIWPKLHLISCWKDGWAESYFHELETLFPHVEIQGKGLLATEGIISIPLYSLANPILTYDTHFYEFRCLQTSQIYTSGNIEINKRYEVIITTGGGLYRYNLNDIVEVVGFKNKTPELRFIGKTNVVSDLTGEKLNEHHVAGVINEIISKHCERNGIVFLKAVREKSFTFYGLYFDRSILREAHDTKAIVKELELGLCENFHYKNSRKMNQLGPAKLFYLSDSEIKTFKEKYQVQHSTQKSLRLIINQI